MMKKTILVSGASGIVGYGILRSLLRNKDQYILIGTTIYKDSIAPAFADIVEIAVPTKADNYVDWLSHVIRKHRVDMIIPGIEIDMYLWNKHRDDIQKAGAIPLLNNRTLINICEDKWEFYKSLINIIPEYLIPTSNDIESNIYGFPCILKPKKGFGSKGVIIIRNEEDYRKCKERINNDLIIQPIVGSDDQEFTVSAFFDKNHNLIDYLPLKRKLSSNGFTEVAQVVDYNFNPILSNIADIVKPIGPTNFQFRLDKDAMKLLEINPRISSSTSIRASFGYNESQMSVDYFIENKIPKQIDRKAINNRKAIRYVEDYIFI